tara:strand:+ start:1978 stop:2427 length:450 start_codon:yes stop_codon:yes gene_type:complete
MIVKKSMVILGVAMVALSGWTAEGWLTDFEAAKKKAAAENRKILVDFSGSDWCGWCIRLDEEVFQQPEWKTYATNSLVQVLVDFPRDKSGQSEAVQKQNDALGKKYKVRGFPTVLLLDEEGKELARTGYQRGGPSNYINHVKELLEQAE